MAEGTMSVYNYIFRESNPLGPILYIVLTKFGVGTALYVGVGKYCPGPYVAEYHKYTSAFCAVFGWMTFWYAFISEPGVIYN